MGWPVVAAALGAGAMSYFGGQQANAANEQMGRDSRDWQTEMSNTAHQREVRDLERAGLNPILSAGGSGASTGSGGIGPAQQNTMAAGVSSAMEARRLSKEIAAVDSQTKLNELAGQAQAASAHRDATTANQIETQTKALKAQMPAIIQKSKTEKKQSEWDEKALEFDNINKRVNQTMGTINSALDNVNPLKRFLPKNETIIDSRTGEILNDKSTSGYRRRGR